jgi:uncharacterized protein YjbI with pentapeptide repeats
MPNDYHINTCNDEDCILDTYKNEKQCILHCKKELSSFNGTEVLRIFNDAFINYLLDNLFKYKEVLNQDITSNILTEYFKKGELNNQKYNDVLKKELLYIRNISFPYSKERDDDTTKLLKLFGEVEFYLCNFNNENMELSSVKVFFDECHFYNAWTLYNYDLLENVSNVTYQICTFHKDVNNYIPKKNELAIYNNPQFDAMCKFKSSLIIDKCILEKELFKITQMNNKTKKTIIKCLIIKNSIINDNFSINKIKILNFNLSESTFKGKVKIQYSILEKSSFYNTKFNDLADFYRTQFKEVNFQRSDFNEIVVFAESEFFNNLSFQYAKFMKKSIFMDMILKGELNLRDTIFDDDANFLDMRQNKDSKAINIPIKVENRETARIIKNFFDNSNNIIEANKFYTLEMQKREEELSKNKYANLLEYIVFKFHQVSSNHSQDYLLPLFWIINFTFLFSLFGAFESDKSISHSLISAIITGLFFYIFLLELLVFKYIHKLSSLFYMFALYYIYQDTYDLTYFSTNLNPFSIMKDGSDLTIWIFIYKILIAYLIYQFIISVRQNTRRK